jgi:hypothetical protein
MMSREQTRKAMNNKKQHKISPVDMLAWPIRIGRLESDRMGSASRVFEGGGAFGIMSRPVNPDVCPLP